MKNKLRLRKVKISKVNNVNSIFGGGVDGPEEGTMGDHTCDPVRCTIVTTTNTDTTDGEVTGINNNGTRTFNMG